MFFPMRFPYQRLIVKDPHRKVHAVFRPLIPVDLSRGGRWLPTYGLIDSGADICLFGKDLALRLGLILPSGRQKSLQGIGRGRISFYLHVVTLRIGNHTVKAEVGFSEGISHLPVAILGQKGFFENFLVAFNYPKRWVEVIKARHHALF